MYSTEPEKREETHRLTYLSGFVRKNTGKGSLLTLEPTRCPEALSRSAGAGCPPRAERPQFRRWRTRKSTTAVHYRAWAGCLAIAWQGSAYLRDENIRENELFKRVLKLTRYPVDCPQRSKHTDGSDCGKVQVFHLKAVLQSSGQHDEEIEPVPRIRQIGSLPPGAHRHDFDCHFEREEREYDVVEYLEGEEVLVIQQLVGVNLKVVQVPAIFYSDS